MAEQPVVYSVRRFRRSRAIRLMVRHDGTVHVSAPIRTSLRLIDSFVARKNDWITAVQAKFLALPRAKVGAGTQAEYIEHKLRALSLVSQRVAYFKAIYGFNVGQLVIRNQRTRWGSCNRRGDLSFNYRIVFLPEVLQDYLVVHELCHIAQFNHSAKFWALVAQTIPDYKTRRRQTRQMHLL